MMFLKKSHDLKKTKKASAPSSTTSTPFSFFVFSCFCFVLLAAVAAAAVVRLDSASPRPPSGGGGGKKGRARANKNRTTTTLTTITTAAPSTTTTTFLPLQELQEPPKVLEGIPGDAPVSMAMFLPITSDDSVPKLTDEDEAALQEPMANFMARYGTEAAFLDALRVHRPKIYKKFVFVLTDLMARYGKLRPLARTFIDSNVAVNKAGLTGTFETERDVFNFMSAEHQRLAAKYENLDAEEKQSLRTHFPWIANQFEELLRFGLVQRPTTEAPTTTTRAPSPANSTAPWGNVNVVTTLTIVDRKIAVAAAGAVSGANGGSGGSAGGVGGGGSVMVSPAPAPKH